MLSVQILPENHDLVSKRSAAVFIVSSFSNVKISSLSKAFQLQLCTLSNFELREISMSIYSL